MHWLKLKMKKTKTTAVISKTTVVFVIIDYFFGEIECNNQYGYYWEQFNIEVRCSQASDVNIKFFGEKLIENRDIICLNIFDSLSHYSFVDNSLENIYNIFILFIA